MTLHSVSDSPGHAKVEIRAIAVDEDGSSYISGNWKGQLAWSGTPRLAQDTAPFAAKVSSDGRQEWFTRLGRGSVGQRSIAVGPDGNVVVVGMIWPDPPKGGQSTSTEVQKLNGKDGHDLWASPVPQGGAADVVTISSSSRIFVGGRQPSPGPFPNADKQEVSTRDDDAFVAALSPDGVWEWKKVFGGPREVLPFWQGRYFGKSTSRVTDVSVFGDGLVALGGCGSGEGTNTSIPYGSFVIVQSADGTYFWSKSFPWADCFVSMRPAGTGLAVVHPAPSALQHDRYETNRHEITLFDANGGVLWKRDATRQGGDFGPVGQLSSMQGDVLVLGVGGSDSAGAPSLRLMRIRSDGTVLGWSPPNQLLGVSIWSMTGAGQDVLLGVASKLSPRQMDATLVRLTPNFSNERQK